VSEIREITVEHTVDQPLIDDFYGLYVAAFEPIRTKAAARHMLTADEFADEMTDPRIDKYMVWDADGDAIAMTTVTLDLAAVPWVSAEFFAERFPQHIARGALFYLGYTLVRPNVAPQGTWLTMMDKVVQRFVDERGVCVFDVSTYNDERAVGRFVRALPETYGAVVVTLDTHRYFALDYSATDTPDATQLDAQIYYAAIFDGSDVADAAAVSHR
jgi:hypothetical protein